MLSKSEKAQLIEIEKCERSAGRMKLEAELNQEKEKLCRPFEERIAREKKQRDKALLDAGLFYISSGCGKTHPKLEDYTLETNNRIKAILRE